MAAGNSTFDTIVTTTLRKYHRKLVENLIGQNALFWLLKKRGYVREDRGGRSIVQPLLYGTNSTVKSYSGYDPLDVTPQSGITAAEYLWKYIAGSVTISGQEEFENSGSREKIIGLLQAKIRQLELSMQLKLNEQLFADGTGNSGKDLTGLDIAVEDGTAWSTYGGIDGSDADNSWWRNQWFNFDTEFGASSTFGESYQNSTKGIAAMRKMRNNCTLGNSMPDLIVTTQDLYEAYEANVEGDKLRLTDTALGDAGFRSIKFTGIDMIFDEDMQSEEMLYLNSEFINLVVGKGRNFVSTPFVKPQNQDAKVSQVLFAGNITVSKRDQLGRITAFSVA